jgi:hypothetical protein
VRVVCAVSFAGGKHEKRLAVGRPPRGRFVREAPSFFLRRNEVFLCSCKWYGIFQKIGFL